VDCCDSVAVDSAADAEQVMPDCVFCHCMKASLAAALQYTELICKNEAKTTYNNDKNIYFAA